MVKKRKARLRPKGIVYWGDPADPRSLLHPSHDEKWSMLAEMVGRCMGDKLYDRLKERQRRRLKAG